MTVVLVRDTYPCTDFGESDAAGLQVYMAFARAEGLAAIDRIRDAAGARGVAFDALVVEDHQAAKGTVDAAQTSRVALIVMVS